MAKIAHYNQILNQLVTRVLLNDLVEIDLESCSFWGASSEVDNMLNSNKNI